MSRFFFSLFSLLLTTQVLLGQIEDTLLLQEILNTITVNKEVSPFANCINVNDFTNTDYGKERIHLYVKDEACRTANEHHMLFINRNNNVTPAFKSLGMKGLGVLSIKNCEIYYMDISALWSTNVPILLEIDSVYTTDRTCEFYFSTITSPWKKTAFKLENPPSHLYQFHLSFIKEDTIWKLKSITKNQLQPFVQ